jgi:hypothetical protein
MLPVSNARVHDFTSDRRFFLSGYPVFCAQFGELGLQASGEVAAFGSWR